MATRQPSAEQIDEMLLQELTGRKDAKGSVLDTAPVSPDQQNRDEVAPIKESPALPFRARTTRHADLSSPYEEMFLKKLPVRNRSAIYIGGETKGKLMEVVRRLGWTDISVSSFAENILSHHLELFRQEINRLHRLHNTKDIL